MTFPIEKRESAKKIILHVLTFRRAVAWPDGRVARFSLWSWPPWASSWACTWACTPRPRPSCPAARVCASCRGRAVWFGRCCAGAVV